MNDSMPPSPSPVSLNGELSAVGQMRVYSDEAALDRVWNRLEMRRRSFGASPVVRVVSAAALLAAGVLLGMFIERAGSSEIETALVSSEVLAAPQTPAGPVTESRLRRPRHRAQGKAQRKAEELQTAKHKKGRGLHAKRSVDPDVEEELVEEPLEELAPVVEPFGPPAQPTWSVLADRGEFAGAFQQLDESGGFDAVLTSGTSEELMSLVEVARFVGRQGRAIQALRVVTERFQGDANAPLAAMILGNLLSSAGDAAGAKAAYALNRRLSPGGDFAEDALVREFDMAMDAGDLVSVERLRIQYEAEFPDGRHKDVMLAQSASLAESVEDVVVSPDVDDVPEKPDSKRSQSTKSGPTSPELEPEVVRPEEPDSSSDAL